MHELPTVRELRLSVTAHDYDDAVRFYRDELGLTERVAYSSENGRATILDAGRATLQGPAGLQLTLFTELGEV